MFLRGSFIKRDPGGAEGKGDKKEDLSLEAAITKASEELASKEDDKDKKDDDKKDDKEDKKDGDVKDDKDDDKEDDEDEVSEEEKAKAIQLFRLINDPKTSKETVVLLAKQLGIDKDTTKEEKKEIIASLKDKFKEDLGEDLEFMSDKLYAAMTKLAEGIAEEKTKDLRASVAEAQKEKQMEVLETAYDKVMAQFENSDTLEDEINKLSKVIKIQAGQAPEQYFKTLLYTAAGEKDISLVRVKASEKKDEKKDKDSKGTVQINLDKLNKARKEANSRLASEGDSNKGKETVKETPVNSIGDAISQAIAAIEAKQDK